MALVTSITDRRPIPHEPGEWVVIRKLSGKQLRRSAEARADAGLDYIKKLGGPDAARAFRKLHEQTEALGVVPDAQLPAEYSDDELLSTFDRETTLRFGVASWSYAAAVDDDTLAQLDDVTERWLTLAILRYSDVKRRESETEKNGDTAPSTAS